MEFSQRASVVYTYNYIDLLQAGMAFGAKTTKQNANTLSGIKI